MRSSWPLQCASVPALLHAAAWRLSCLCCIVSEPRAPGKAPRAEALPSWALQKKVASPGHGILAMDESNATCGKRLDSIGLENTESNRRAYRELLVTTPGLGEYISGAILFEETLYQKTSKGPVDGGRPEQAGHRPR